MLRRNFIANTVATGTLALIPAKYRNTMANKYKFGIQLFSVNRDMNRDPIETLKAVKTMGYEDCEVYGFDPEKVSFYGIPALDLKKRMTDIGLSASSGHFGFASYFEQSDDNMKQYVDQCIKGAKALELSYICLLYTSILIIHIANVASFFNRTVYYDPRDGKNLNRQFPGNQNGTITELLAYTISSKIIQRCNYVADIHAGDANEDLHPYVAIYEYGTQTAKAKQMALALDFPWIIISENAPKPGMPTLYCTAETVSKDIPVVGIEYGKLGQVQNMDAEYINKRLKNMMRSLGVLPGHMDTANKPVEIRKRSSIRSNQTGIFYTDYRSGALFKKGAKLGFITDLFGNVIQEIMAPFDGFIIYVTITPPINNGEMLFSIASF